MKSAFLPCNGLDKPAGPLTRELALCLAQETGGGIVCPVLLNQAPDRYREMLAGLPLTVIDGCATRCASKLAARLQLPESHRIFIPDELKKAPVKPENGMVPGPLAMEFIRQTARLRMEPTAAPEPASVPVITYPAPENFLRVTVDKFVFKIPAEGFLFNENGCWVQAVSKRARVGLSDYLQQNLTDLSYFEPPEVGTVVEQFGELGVVESSKAAMEIVSPVSGQIVAVNMELKDKPELVNEDPYGKGWIAELELTDWVENRQFLLEPGAYAGTVRKKAAESLSK